MTPSALSIDLFGTIVFFDSTRVPRRTLNGRERIWTVPDLEDILADALPDITPDRFLDVVDEESRNIWRGKALDRREVPTAERYRRALAALGAASAIPSAEAMASSHMQTLATAVTCPPDRRELLEQLSETYALALTSNFDDGPTARALLNNFGLSQVFKSIIVSAETGFVKPAAEMFTAACRGVGAKPAECLHVGDSFDADVCGAREAGLETVWISGEETEESVARIGDLRELPAWLRARYP